MKPVYGDSSLRNRAMKLAARPKCGFRWVGVGEHVCLKPKNHKGKDHRCECRATKRKAK